MAIQFYTNSTLKTKPKASVFLLLVILVSTDSENSIPILIPLAEHTFTRK